MATTSPHLSFLNVSPGVGGTFSFQSLPQVSPNASKPTIEPTKHIGTTSCRTCVGVYFKLDPDRFFIAHIHVSLFVDKSRAFWNDILPEEGEDLKQEVIRAMRINAEAEDWDPESLLPDIEKSLVMVCPSLVVYSQLKTTGWYVTKAIQECLGVRDFEVDTGSQGFVVGLGGVEKRIAAARTDAMDGLQVCDMREMARDWSFDVIRKEWCSIKGEWCSCGSMGLCYRKQSIDAPRLK